MIQATQENNDKKARGVALISWSPAVTWTTRSHGNRQHKTNRHGDDTWTMSYQRFFSRLSKEEQDFYETKYAAAEFYRVNRVPEEMERALNELFLQKPEDVHGYLVWVCFPAVDR